MWTAWTAHYSLPAGGGVASLKHTDKTPSLSNNELDVKSIKQILKST